MPHQWQSRISMLISQQKYFTKPPVIPPIRYFLTQTLTVLLCSSDETLAVEPRGNGTSYKTFIDLLTTVHFISVLTAFATYFGVIQRDWHSLPLGFFFFFIRFFLLHIYVLVGNADSVSSTVYKPKLFFFLFFFFKFRHSQLQTRLFPSLVPVCSQTFPWLAPRRPTNIFQEYW